MVGSITAPGFIKLLVETKPVVANNYFQFKEFTIRQDRCAMKVTTDGCLFGAWLAQEVGLLKQARATILDIGTGTGLLSLMLAQKTDSRITAIEIDKEAFQQASENIDASPWKDKLSILHEDIKKFTPSNSFDVVLSNPPFYENEWLSENSKRNIAHHSSELLVETLLDTIANLLAPEGKFYLLLPYKRHNEIFKLFAQKKIAVSQKIMVRQTSKHSFFRMMIEGSFNKPANTSTSEIAIRNSNNEYTAEFITLLKDYYLYM